MGRAHVARPRRPRPGRCPPGAAALAGRGPGRGGDLLRPRPRDHPAAGRRDAAGQARPGRVRRPGRGAEDPAAARRARGARELLHARRVGAAAPRRGARPTSRAATRSASTAGSTSATCCSPARTSSTSPAAPLETLEKLSGVRPVGIRTPSWDFSDHTLAIIEELGLVYDSSLMADDEPYELLADGRPTGIVEIPVEWIRDDAPYLMMERYGGAAAVHAAAAACSTSGATSSTPRTPRAGCSSSPCTRTSSGTAPGSASCASCSRTSRATPTSGSPPMRRSPTWRAHSYPRGTRHERASRTAPTARVRDPADREAAQGDRRRRDRQRRRMGGLGRVRHPGPRLRRRSSSPRATRRPPCSRRWPCSPSASSCARSAARCSAPTPTATAARRGSTLTIGLMAGAAILIAICPTYEAIGVAAPLILLLGPAGAGLLGRGRVRFLLLVPGRVGRAAAAGLRGFVAAGLGRARACSSRR